jgi:signal recognition particle subunit SRP54
MASNLTDRLSRLVKTMRGQARITEDNVQDMLREVRMALLEADVALPVVRDFVARVKARALGAEVVGSLSPGQALVGIVHRELAATMGEGVADLDLATQPPAVILMAGLQGAGKTTTTAKLAKYLIERRKKKVLTVSADVYRPAAIEQLKTVTRQSGAEWFPSTATDEPLAIARAALDYARKHLIDVLLVDTAGRLQNRTELMDELEKMVRVMKKLDATAPHAVLLVLDATVGQNALSQAAEFSRIAGVTGLVMTKLDGTARGGILVALAAKHKLPVHFIGVGEGVDDLSPFAAKDFANAIAGIES